MEYIDELLESVMERERECTNVNTHCTFMISVQFQCSNFTISPSPYDPQQTPFLHTLVSLVTRFSLVSLTWGKMG